MVMASGSTAPTTNFDADSYNAERLKLDEQVGRTGEGSAVGTQAEARLGRAGMPPRHGHAATRGHICPRQHPVQAATSLPDYLMHLVSCP